MTPALRSQILHLLFADETIDDATLNLVDAACEGDVSLTAALAELTATTSPTAPARPSPTKTTPPAAYLCRLTVAGFRGIGPEQTLEFTPGPGLTLLLGRNGSGKSSFAEGLETLLTGESRRWAGRPKEWQSGWKNLHTDGASFVEATFAVEGGEPVVVRRGWKAQVELGDSELRVRRGSDKFDGLESLGWTEALAMFRPFLSYAELGALLNRPSELYDTLKGILGLEEVAAAVKRLSVQRKARADRKKVSVAARKVLLERLETVLDDERAQRCKAALDGRKWQLDEVEAVVLGDDADDHDDAVTLVRSLVQITCPGVEEIGEAVTQLRASIAAQAQLADTSAGLNAQLAGLLERALHHCQDGADACPVCGGALAEDWASGTRARLEETKALASRATTTAAELDRCHKLVRSKIRAMPPALARVEEVELSTALRDAWQQWVDLPAEAAALGDHAEEKIVALVDALAGFTAEARAKLEAVQSVWRPVALEVAQWLEGARTVEADLEALSALDKADKWLKQTEGQLRDDRFTPIAERAQEIWTSLRQQSNVDLARVKLTGTSTKRRVELNVTVDGKEGVAVSVMSQGELNALALSLFLPRMTLADSPFHFLVIDDPVQAMDPHKVDGLARVLDQVAQSRQVIVLTHDARLYEAIRRLGIRAKAIAVQRRSDSVVELKETLDPVERHLRDAWQIVNNAQTIGAKTAARTVPAFCRLAMEAACIEAVRRRRLARGDTHVDVEEAIEGARGVHDLAALALFDDKERASEVFRYLNNNIGDWAADRFREVKEGSHGNFRGAVGDLVNDSRKIAQAFRRHR